MKRAAAHAPLTIHRVEAIPVSVPLVKPVLMGGGQRLDRSETLLVRVTTRDGLTGWGEASAAPTMTGESSIAAAALTHIGYAIPNLAWGININNHYLAADLGARRSGSKAAAWPAPAAPASVLKWMKRRYGSFASNGFSRRGRGLS